MGAFIRALAGAILVSVLAAMSRTWAQPVPRIKAQVLSFDGKTLTIMPQGQSEKMSIGVRPTTRLLKQEKKTLADVKIGDFIGSIVAGPIGGHLNAQEVHIFPDALRGSGEGFYPLPQMAERSIINGTVVGSAGGILTLKFRGMNSGDSGCSGRAPPQGGCSGTVNLSVPAAAAVTALEDADQKELVPGAVIAISLMAGPDGRLVTPGLTIETADTDSAVGGRASSPTIAGKRRP